jgi:hypothetical protein
MLFRTAVLAGAVALLAAAAAPTLDVRFDGRWQAVAGINDGRLNGRSTRTYHPGDTVNITFDGAGLDVYGITGPNGGYAALIFPPKPDLTLDFYSPQKRAHVLLYSSPGMTREPHVATIVVLRTHDPRSSGTYVNVDEISAR